MGPGFLPTLKTNSPSGRTKGAVSIRWLLRLFAVAILLALVACSAGDGQETGAAKGGGSRLIAPEFEELPGSRDGSQLAPLSSEEVDFVSRSEFRAVRACMQEQGFEYPIDDLLEGPPGWAPNYLLPGELRRSGYQVGVEFLRPASPSETAIAKLLETMDPDEKHAWEAAFRGDGDSPEIGIQDGEGGVLSVATGGCLGEGRKRLYGSIENYLRYDRAVQQFEGGGVTLALETFAEYRGPLTDWQACMRGRGHEVSDIEDFGLNYLRRTATGFPVSEDMIRQVALADADCQESSGLHEERERLLPQALAKVAADLSLEVDDYVRFQHAVLDRASNL